MNIKTKKSMVAVLTAITSVILIGPVSAQWTISRPGAYKLNKNYTVKSGGAIIITASNVTLDLNGFGATTSADATTTAPAPGPNGTNGITITGAKNVVVKNGHVSKFNSNVLVTNSQNVRIEGLQISGENLAPAGGPTEVGITIVNSSACDILNNTISSTNLGIFVRGAGSNGNRLMKNIVTGGVIRGNNLLGICYNPDGSSSVAGPSGDSIYNNHIARYNFAISVSEGSMSNMFNDNTLASLTGPFRETNVFATQGGTNVEFDNTSVLLPATP